MRTAGDLVAWMQLKGKMKIHEAKQYVARKLGVEVADLADEEFMRQRREQLGIGILAAVAGSPRGIRAKMAIARLLDIRINSVELFRSRM